MNKTIFERLTERATILDAEQELLELGENSLPILQAILDSTAKNAFGVPYRNLGTPLTCALEVASRLGSIAKPIEPLLRLELLKGSYVAAMALGALNSLEEESIELLATQLGASDVFLSSESAAALSKCGCSHHPLVIRVIGHSDAAAKIWERQEKLNG